jgi:hypothetical protein
MVCHRSLILDPLRELGVDPMTDVVLSHHHLAQGRRLLARDAARPAAVGGRVCRFARDAVDGNSPSMYGESIIYVASTRIGSLAWSSHGGAAPPEWSEDYATT